MAPSRVGVFPVIDINNDGKPDAVLLQTSDTIMKARDQKGRKVTICEQSVEFRPMVATETTGIYIPFHAQDRCKLDEDFARIKAKTYKNEGIFWRYTSADTPFAATIGGTPFYVGQAVMQVGQKKPQVIEAFRVGLQQMRDEKSENGSRYVLGPVEAMFAGCRAVTFDQLTPIKK